MYRTMAALLKPHTVDRPSLDRFHGDISGYNRYEIGDNEAEDSYNYCLC